MNNPIHLEPSYAVLTRKNFSAGLPEDFGMLISIESGNSTLWYSLPTNTVAMGNPDKPYIPLTELHIKDYFVIDLSINKIIFSGSFSKYWLIRIFQQLSEWINPKTYILKYHKKSTNERKN